MTVSVSPRLRPAYDAGRQAHASGYTLGQVHTHVANAYKTRERRRAFVNGWLDADRKAMWESFPMCPVCSQPCAPPISEEDRTWIDHPDHPWHPDSGLELPHE